VVRRIVLLKLEEHLATAAGREEVARYSAACLQRVPGVRLCEAGVAGDAATEASWDVQITVELDSVADYEIYAVDPTHRAYLDEYLPSLCSFKKAWNFEVLSG
jgi:hypothetical protein